MGAQPPPQVVPRLAVSRARHGRQLYRHPRSSAPLTVTRHIELTESCTQVRSFYRCVELSEGYSGYLTRTEIYFFVLDFAPLLVAVAVYLPFWPGRFIPNNVSAGRAAFEEVALESAEDTLHERYSAPRPHGYKH